MSQAQVEHVNITVSNPKKTAEILCKLFGWKVRWHGTAMNGLGITYHVGSDDTYIAVYAGHTQNPADKTNYDKVGGLNHIGVLVDDIDATERLVIDAGFKPKSHADYEPGRRFYFFDHDGVEYEVVSY